MMKKQDEQPEIWDEDELLHHICRNSAFARRDYRVLMRKVEDELLAVEMNSQAAKYGELEEEAARLLMKKGKVTPEESLPRRAGQWAALQAETALNISTPHLAELLEKQQEKRLWKTRRLLRAYRPAASGEACELAKELMDFERQTLEALKRYC